MFAPPAIALAIGAYLNIQFPSLDPKIAALGAYIVFITLNIIGVQIAATFELFVTILAVGELLVFMGVVSPAFSFANFAAGGWGGEDTFSMAAVGGIFAAIPFAIWFFLAIEGVAMAAEEAKDPSAPFPSPTSPASSPSSCWPSASCCLPAARATGSPCPTSTIRCRRP